MSECRDCAYSDRPIYKWPCDVCRATKNGRSMYCPEEADHIANEERKTDYISRQDFRKELIDMPFRPRCKITPDLMMSVQDRLNDTLELLDNFPAADVRPVRPCDGCPFCVCEKHGVICPSDPDFRCDTRGGTL